MKLTSYSFAIGLGLWSLSAAAQVTPTPDSSTADTTKRKYVSEEIVISATRANDMTPVTQYNLNQAQIKEKYYGADIPTFLNSTPSVNSYSDAGNGIGYSYISLRGLEPKRINFSINGIPVNDPETQGFYTNNFADLLSSAKSIQVQRGVGTSANGTAALAGSISVITKDLSLKPEASITVGYGSFNSRRITGEVQTGLIANKFAFYGRLSEIASDGYRYNSGAQIRTFFVSAGYFGKKSLLKFNAFGGTAIDKLAYNGIDKPTMDQDRRSNPLTAAETDQFQQYFYQLQYTYEFNQHLNLSAQAYYVKGLAPAFNVLFPASWGYGYSNFNLPNAIVGTETVTGTNVLANYRLNQDYLGGMAFLNYKKDRLGLNVGIH
ncbi:MAG: TonB-dependent receptor plug domain-containing protein, partial [Cytophagales bacterium]|nr:TonB-dependent receptor plug domain-containing protein [Cytophagales bacterium]